MEPAKPSRLALSEDLARGLGAVRAARLAHLARRTDLAPEALLNLALGLLELVADSMRPAPEQRTAISLAAARWRDVAPAERSAIMRRAAQARWARRRTPKPEE